jgi:hypothetical protein
MALPWGQFTPSMPMQQFIDRRWVQLKVSVLISGVRRCASGYGLYAVISGRSSPQTSKRKRERVLDNAGWYLGKGLEVPKNIRFLSLPPYSPELNPMENIWDDLREKSFHNKTLTEVPY